MHRATLLTSFVFVIVASVLASFSCTEQGTTETPCFCEPGETKTCPLENGYSGYQRCRDDCLGWEDCTCETCDFLNNGDTDDKDEIWNDSDQETFTDFDEDIQVQLEYEEEIYEIEEIEELEEIDRDETENERQECIPNTTCCDYDGYFLTGPCTPSDEQALSGLCFEGECLIEACLDGWQVSLDQLACELIIDGDIDQFDLDNDGEEDCQELDLESDDEENETELEEDLTENGNGVLSPNVIVLLPEVADESSYNSGDLLVPIESARRRSESWLTNLDRLAPNMILIGEKNPDQVSAGLVMRVQDIVEVNNNYRVTPDHSNRPTLDEIIEQGQIQIADTIDFIDDYTNRDGVGFNRSNEPLSCTVASGITASTRLGVNFTPQFEFDAEINFYQIHHLRAYLGGNFHAEAEMLIEAVGSGSCGSGEDDQEIWVGYRDIIVYVGGAPIVLRAKAKLFMGYAITTEGSIEMSAGASADSNIGIELVYDNGWERPNPIANFYPEGIGPNISMDFAANAQLWLRAEVSVLVYGFAGPFLGVKPGVELDINNHSDNEYYWNVDFYNSFYAGCKVELLGTTIAEISYNNLIPSNSEIASGCLSGECCRGLTFKASGEICDYEADVSYRCDPTGCGGTIKKRIDIQHCTGDSASCLGQISEGLWSVHENCIDGYSCTETQYLDVDCVRDTNCDQVVECENCPLCNNHGFCQNDTCVCNNGFAGVCCDRCADGYVEYPNCRLTVCSETCSGCCDGETCQSGTTNTYCGSGGNSCNTCSSSEECSNGICTEIPCSQTCDGCCDSDNNCHFGTLDDYCGENGEQCDSCGFSEVCYSGNCVEAIDCSDVEWSRENIYDDGGYIEFSWQIKNESSYKTCEGHLEVYIMEYDEYGWYQHFIYSEDVELSPGHSLGHTGYTNIQTIFTCYRFNGIIDNTSHPGSSSQTCF